MSSENRLEIIVEFGGGAELMFGNERKLKVIMPASDSKWTIRHLLAHLKEQYAKGGGLERFFDGDSVTAGILVLINDFDWELADTINYELKSNDNITFISTLHGG